MRLGFFITALIALFAVSAATDENFTNYTNTNDNHSTTNYTDPTRIESYSVNTTIESRFARTHVTVDFVNERNCSTIRSFTFQLPLAARVTNLVMSSSNGCTMNSTVKEEAQAQEEFNYNAAQGKPAALLTAYDSTNYLIEVSLPPLGKTRVDFSFEELLLKKSHQIPFQIPLSPGLPVERLQVDVSVREPQTGVETFYMDQNVEFGDYMDINLSEAVASAHFERTHLTTDDATLPRLLRGYYNPGPLPADGLLIPDRSGSCLVHLFNPNSLLESAGSLPRDIVFVVDVSGSMNGQKLSDAKAAFAAIIEKLTSEDYFTIHTFSDNGIEDSWGPGQATAESKLSASRFVQARETIGGTNLNDAYVDGIYKVENMHNARRDGSSQYAVPIVMMLSDGQGSLPGAEVSTNVRNANERVKSKIFNLAFGSGADLDLLTGISIQNGGVTAQIYEGYGDAVTQMEDFYVGELGTILMSDLDVSFDGTGVDIDSHTQSLYSVFADGSEVAVRARILQSTTTENDPARTIRATTIANTLQGTNTWQTDLQLHASEARLGDTSQECLRSFSHAKIAEILQFRDAARSLGEEMNDYAPSYLIHNGIILSGGESRAQAQVRQSSSNQNLVEVAEAQALELALEAGVVWPGLTAIVTVTNSFCQSLQSNSDTQVCFDGDGVGGNYNDDMHGEVAGNYGAPAGKYGAPARSDISSYSNADFISCKYSFIIPPVMAIAAMVMIVG